MTVLSYYWNCYIGNQKGAHRIMISKSFKIFLHHKLSSQPCQLLLCSSRVSQAYNVIRYTAVRISALCSLEIMLISINVLAGVNSFMRIVLHLGIGSYTYHLQFGL